MAEGAGDVSTFGINWSAIIQQFATLFGGHGAGTTAGRAAEQTLAAIYKQMLVDSEWQRRRYFDQVANEMRFSAAPGEVSPVVQLDLPPARLSTALTRAEQAYERASALGKRGAGRAVIAKQHLRYAQSHLANYYRRNPNAVSVVYARHR